MFEYAFDHYKTYVLAEKGRLASLKGTFYEKKAFIKRDVDYFLNEDEKKLVKIETEMLAPKKKWKKTPKPSRLKPVFTAIGFPPEVVPLAFIRPISGTAALGMTSDLIATYGPDSFIGQLAAVMQGSTDTTLYILTVYFGAVGIKKMGDALKVGLLADLIGVIASVIIVSLLFSGA
ncbi:hypothetical protein BSAF29S_03905 [Bacillus safensis subsp. safensis]